MVAVARKFFIITCFFETMHSLRTYLEKLREIVPDQLVSVKEQVDWRYEVTARVAEMERERKNPALLLENVKDYPMPLLVNLFGHVDRITLGLKGAPYVDGSRLEFYDAWNGLFEQEVLPVQIETGSVKDVKLTGGDVNLESLPIPLFYREDGGRYVTAGLMAARNPDDPEEVNLSYVRMHLKGRDSFGVSFHSRGHMWRYLESSKTLGRPMEVAVIIGAHPSLYLAAAAKIGVRCAPATIATRPPAPKTFIVKPRSTEEHPTARVYEIEFSLVLGHDQVPGNAVS